MSNEPKRVGFGKVTQMDVARATTPLHAVKNQLAELEAQARQAASL